MKRQRTKQTAGSNLARSKNRFQPVPGGTSESVPDSPAHAARPSATGVGFDFGHIDIHAAAPVGIQPKLVVGAPNDRYEQEADRVADQVMRMPDPSHSSDVSFGHQANAANIQRLCPECEEEMDKQIQAKHLPGGATPATPEMESQIHSLKGKGGPLSDSERAFFEPRFGRDLSHVRIHTGRQAAEMASSLNARAFTLGNDIVFGRGEYKPGTTEGRHLVAHELTHVGQQTQQLTTPVIQRKSTCRDWRTACKSGDPVACINYELFCYRVLYA